LAGFYSFLSIVFMVLVNPSGFISAGAELNRPYFIAPPVVPSILRFNITHTTSPETLRNLGEEVSLGSGRRKGKRMACATRPPTDFFMKGWTFAREGRVNALWAFEPASA
jgi:hypothetical protein